MEETMIWPWSFRWRGLSQVSVTFALMLVNVMLFVILRDLPKEKAIEKSLSGEQLMLTGRLYAQYQGKSSSTEAELVQSLRRALEDEKFIHLAPHLEFKGDQVEIRHWKKAWADYYHYLDRRTLRIFGLSSDRDQWSNAISYQFMHADGLHLLSNMTLLVLFGFAIELSLGGFWVLAVYLLGGSLGGFFYLTMTGFSMAPMVGASISVSALIGFYLMIERRRSIRYMYFFSPFPGYFGEVWMSKWALVPLFMVSDLIVLLRPESEMSPVAHLGHLGGLVFGLAVGGALHLVIKEIPQWEQSLFASYSQSHSEAPES